MMYLSRADTDELVATLFRHHIELEQIFQMINKKSSGLSGFEKISAVVTKASGTTTAFMSAMLIILLWLFAGPVFKYSDTWQLVINTGTTIITFLMVFLIQRSQNKDSIAIHLKLNELVVAHEHANNRLVAVEDISENELKVLQRFYSHLARMTKDEQEMKDSHSIDKANIQHNRKKTSGKPANPKGN